MTLSDVTPIMSLIGSMIASKFRLVSSAPFGSPVVPEVYSWDPVSSRPVG